MSIPIKFLMTFAFLFVAVFLPPKAISGTQGIGIVVMHGKGGLPSKHVTKLASTLEENGYLVANLEMPWSSNRDYDVSVSVAAQEVEAALSALRDKGAKKVFVAGHSQGGVFSIYFGGQHIVDGIIAIAPGGSVASSLFREQLGDQVDEARKLVAEGKGDEKTKLYDFEGAKGKYPVVTTPAAYLTWFDPDGAMNLQRSIRAMRSQTPILWIVAARDYPQLRKSNIPMFETLPPNLATKFYEPQSDHLGAPSASIDEIVRWTTEVSAR